MSSIPNAVAPIPLRLSEFTDYIERVTIILKATDSSSIKKKKKVLIPYSIFRDLCFWEGGGAGHGVIPKSRDSDQLPSTSNKTYF